MIEQPQIEATANDPRTALRLRDRASVYYTKELGRLTEKVVELVTIDRPDRWTERRTYSLEDLSPATKARILNVIFGRYWPERKTTIAGWHAVSGDAPPTQRDSDADERIDQLIEAREHLQSAIELIRSAVRRTSEEQRAESYILPTLAMCLGGEHGYLGGQTANIAELIDTLREEGELEIDSGDWTEMPLAEFPRDDMPRFLAAAGVPYDKVTANDDGTFTLHNRVIPGLPANMRAAAKLARNTKAIIMFSYEHDADSARSEVVRFTFRAIEGPSD